MIFGLWSGPVCDGNVIIVSSQRWWDARTLFTHVYGILPEQWETLDDKVKPDYETRWIGSAAQSAANLQMQYRKCKKGAKWVTL